MVQCILDTAYIFGLCRHSNVENGITLATQSTVGLNKAQLQCIKNGETGGAGGECSGLLILHVKIYALGSASPIPILYELYVHSR